MIKWKTDFTKICERAQLRKMSKVEQFCHAPKNGIRMSLRCDIQSVFSNKFCFFTLHCAINSEASNKIWGSYATLFALLQSFKKSIPLTKSVSNNYGQISCWKKYVLLYEHRKIRKMRIFEIMHFLYVDWDDLHH